MVSEDVIQVQRSNKIIGRPSELQEALYGIAAKRHTLIEGPVGVGKTVMAVALADHFHRNMYRVDGDERYTEQKMVGWFDPPVVLTKGYTKDAFIEGPLYKAMSEGAFLFINELNRMPEGTQNVLLPAMDEGKIVVPRIGTVIAKDGFAIIATQNPEEYIGTSRLSEALKDRFVWIRLDYQSEKEEVAIVKKETGSTDDLLVSAAVKIARKTRETPDLRRGASVRGAIDIVSIAQQAISEPLSELKPEMMRKVIEISTVMSLSSKIEQRESSHEKLMETLTKIVDNVLKELRLIAAPGIIEPSDAEGHSRNF